MKSLFNTTFPRRKYSLVLLMITCSLAFIHFSSRKAISKADAKTFLVAQVSNDETYCDGFEDIQINPFWTVTNSTAPPATSSLLFAPLAHSGSASITLSQPNFVTPGFGASLTHNFATPQKGKVAVWMYDSAPGFPSLSAFLSIATQNGFCLVGVQNVYLGSNAPPLSAQADPTQYAVILGDLSQPVERSQGWHYFEIFADSTKCEVSIDSQLVSSKSGDFRFSSLSLAFNGINLYPLLYTPYTQYFFDDFCFEPVNSNEFAINFSTFIPGNSIAGPPQSRGNCPPKLLYFAGDDRGFSSTATSYRTRQLITIAPDEGTFVKAGTVYNLVGETRSYASDALADGKIDAADNDDVLHDCHLLHDKATASNDRMHIIAYRINDKKIGIRLFGSAGDPLVFVPNDLKDIDWDFTLTIDISGQRPHWTLQGLDDGFPAFEIYINGTPIYTRDAPPPYSFQDLLKLLPGYGDVTVNRSGDLP
jgi:hypothetical protein